MLQRKTTGRIAANSVRYREKKPIFIIGGTGKTGSRVADRLQQMDWPLVIGSRSGAPGFDWQDTRTWLPALKGMDAVYITFQPDLSVPGASDAIRHLCQVAHEADVKRLVLLSGRGETEAEACEQVVMQSGLGWTILRCSWFCQNFSESIFLEQVRAGFVALPAGAVKEPFVDIDDIAEVAVASLTETGHHGQLYEITGPELLSFSEAVAEIAAAAGRDIHYERIGMAEYAAALREYQLPEDLIRLVTYLFSEVLDGRNASVCDGVERALGRKPTDFASFARKVAATGTWG